MLLAVGVRVKLKHSGEEGVITGLLDGGMVNVHLTKADMEIPAFEEDLVRTEDFWQEQKIHKPVKASYRTIENKPQKAVEDTFQPPMSQYAILKSLGLSVVFDPVIRDGQSKEFKVYLINDTAFDLLVTADLHTNQHHKIAVDEPVKATSFLEIGAFDFEDLNNAAVLTATCRQLTTEGAGELLTKELKIKAQQFFKHVRTAPLLNKEVHLYVLFDKFLAEPPQKEENLSSYTKRNTKPLKTTDLRRPKKLNLHDIAEFAGFVPEIDLHIEKLSPDHKRMGHSEIHALQLRHFENFLDKAIRLGISRVFIIHGVGEGRLRDSIAGRLLRYPEVSSFKNEYHPRYGYGATEVTLE